MNKLEITNEEIDAIQTLLSLIAQNYKSAEDVKFLKEVTFLAHKLPDRICKTLLDFKAQEPFPGICLISGYPVDQKKIGRTPAHWNEREKRTIASPALEEELFLMLCGSLLGEVFGFITEQNGYLVNDVLPIKGHDYDQVGSSSNTTLGWHNEDAFHPYRGDYLALMCMRNPYEAVTRYASIDIVPLEKEQKESLFESHFVIRPDNAHLHHLQELKNLDDTQRRAIGQMYAMNKASQYVPVLYGDFQSPYVVMDPYYMDQVEDEEARKAFDVLIEGIEKYAGDVILRPGDILFIDNYKAVHGRKPFEAKYDGNDRWLKRINITRDLRKSRNARAKVDSRIIV